MNSSNKDGIGIAASFNKFLAFSEKNDVSLSYGFFGTVDQAGEKSIPTDFLNTDAIRNTGNSLGMFADASKDIIITLYYIAFHIFTQIFDKKS